MRRGAEWRRTTRAEEEEEEEEKAAHVHLHLPKLSKTLPAPCALLARIKSTLVLQGVFRILAIEHVGKRSRQATPPEDLLLVVALRRMRREEEKKPEGGGGGGRGEGRRSRPRTYM